ncbi:hypothetical protein V6N12_076269 [Hibiscus sabdariffa]|uniref:Uncharacterized protein n=1 Tax=Hibiscus sabdariffa TaxID=183260 RepID=A0ABR2AC43_9ROSI
MEAQASCKIVDEEKLCGEDNLSFVSICAAAPQMGVTRNHGYVKSLRFSSVRTNIFATVHHFQDFSGVCVDADFVEIPAQVLEQW